MYTVHTYHDPGTSPDLHQHVGGAPTDGPRGVLDGKVVVLQVLPAVGSPYVVAQALALHVEPVDHEDRSQDPSVQCLGNI